MITSSDEYYRNCVQCPRKCGTDRTKSSGFCGETYELRAASACLHYGEEPLLTVFGGSGTIFFTGCTLRCSFCQNYQISQQGYGESLSKEVFSDICLKLESMGAENINLVTGSHHIPKIAEFLSKAKSDGLKIPVAWNSSGYESVESLELLDGLVDIWLPDLKTLNPIMSKRLFMAEDYPSVAKKAIRHMMKTPLKFTEIEKNGEVREKILSGTIIRHLFLPGRMEDSRITLEWLKEHAQSTACLSLMTQYTPVPFKGSEEELKKRNEALGSFQNRMVNAAEDRELRQMIEDCEFEYLFCQDLSDDSSWLPDFTRNQPFSNKLALPAWHCKV